MRLAAVVAVRLRRLGTELIVTPTPRTLYDGLAIIQRALLPLDADIGRTNRDLLRLGGASAALHQLRSPLARPLTLAAVDEPATLPAMVLRSYVLSVSEIGADAETILARAAAHPYLDQGTRDTVAFLRSATAFR